MTNDNQSALKGWAGQLAKDVAPYVQQARDRSHGMTVVLFMRPDGKIGSPKITIQTGDPRVGIDPEEA